jgi:uncharacterized membrane protein YkvA (DUF1232 family)
MAIKEAIALQMFEKAAVKILGKKAKLVSLIGTAGIKLVKNKGAMAEVKENLNAVVRLVQAYAKGNYKQAPWKSLVMIVAAILYFVSPIDLIPDFILGLGFADDIAVITFVYKSIQKDIEKFLAWERIQDEVNIDDAVAAH